MLNPFPSLLAFGLFAPFILRLALGGIFLHAGYLKLFKNRDVSRKMFSKIGLPFPGFFFWLVAIVELAGSLFILAGFETQIAAILLSLVSLGGLIVKTRHKELLPQSSDFYVLTLAISLALILFGAGKISFDLPL